MTLYVPRNTPGVDGDRLRRLREREDEAFLRRTPRSAAMLARGRRCMPDGVPMSWMAGLYRHPPVYVASGQGARFQDVDGNVYCDFNVCDLSMTMGFGAPAIARAVTRQAEQGAHFLLPTEDALRVCELLAERVGLPYWQFTLSASGANTEIIRIARTLTGRPRVVVFDGKYHGHIDETLVELRDGRVAPELLGLARGRAADTIILPFNDLEAVERALAAGDVALVLTEPVLTNCTLVQPDDGFLAGLRAATLRHGTLLAYDEAHSFQFAYGGLVGSQRLACDFVTLGKGLGSGVSFALYGMSEAIAQEVERHRYVDHGAPGLATGGTMYASALAAAAARAALEEVLTPDAYTRLDALGARLADGIDAAIRYAGLPWRAFRLGPRSGLCLTAQLPRNAIEAAASLDPVLIDTRRVYMANHGVWDSIISAGPQVSFVHEPEDVDLYVRNTSAFLQEIIA